METQEPKILPRLWTASEVDELRHLYQYKSATNIAIQMGRTYASVNGKLQKLRLFKVGTRPWTATEVDYLRSSYPSQLTTVAIYMGRSYNSVKCKAKRLRLSKVCSIDDIDDSVKETTVVAVSNQIAQPKGIDLVRRESYVAPPWASFRASADDHFKYKSKGF